MWWSLLQLSTLTWSRPGITSSSIPANDAGCGSRPTDFISRNVPDNSNLEASREIGISMVKPLCCTIAPLRSCQNSQGRGCAQVSHPEKKSGGVLVQRTDTRTAAEVTNHQALETEREGDAGFNGGKIRSPLSRIEFHIARFRCTFDASTAPATIQHSIQPPPTTDSSSRSHQLRLRFLCFRNNKP